MFDMKQRGKSPLHVMVDLLLDIRDILNGSPIKKKEEFVVPQKTIVPKKTVEVKKKVEAKKKVVKKKKK